MGDCDNYRGAFGHLVFVARDFGEWMEIAIELSRELHVEAEIEGKQCSPIHCAAGFSYGANKKRKKRAPPSRAVVKQLSREIRLAEYNNA